MSEGLERLKCALRTTTLSAFNMFVRAACICGNELQSQFTIIKRNDTENRIEGVPITLMGQSTKNIQHLNHGD